MAPSSKARPRDWHPLSEDRYTDPTPGDVDDLRSGRKTMAATAKEIKEQIKRLKAIGEGEGLKGKYVEELKDGADKLKAKLEKTSGRYERVASQLKQWENKLEHAQSETAAALEAAQDAETTIKQLVGSTDEDSKAVEKAEKDLSPHKEEQLKEARRKLAGARTRYREAVDDYEPESGRIAKKIRDIIDDDIEDGFWSWASNWIERNLDTLKKALEVLGYIATVLAIAALVITIVAAFTVLPGGWLLAAGIMMKVGTGIAYATAITHGVMAATGNGGWGDVVFDIVGLVTMHMGNAAIAGIKRGAQATRSASVKAGRQQVKSNRQRPEVRDRLKQFEDRKAAAKTDAMRKAIQKEKEDYLKRQKPKGVAQELPKPTPMEVLKAGGDRNAAAQLRFTAGEAAKRSGDDATLAAARETSKQGGRNLSLFAAGTGMDLGDKAIGSSDLVPEKWNVGPYGDLKDANFTQVGWYDVLP